MGEPVLDRVVRGQRWVRGLSSLADAVTRGIFRLMGPLGPVAKSLLNGTYLLRHPLHAVLTDVPLGAWTVAVAADLVHAWRPGLVPVTVGDFCLVVGLVAALAAVATGYTDHLDISDGSHRKDVAIIHGLLMSVATLLYAASALLRFGISPRHQATAVLLGLAGYGLLVAGGYIGGHQVFGLGTGVSRNAFHRGPSQYTRVAAAGDVADGSMKCYTLEGGDVMVLRTEGRLRAMSSVCSHEGAPLCEGRIDGGEVVCPWHGSRFSTTDGTVVGGPATLSLPAYDVRERDGVIEVKLAAPAND